MLSSLFLREIWLKPIPPEASSYVFSLPVVKGLQKAIYAAQVHFFSGRYTAICRYLLLYDCAVGHRNAGNEFHLGTQCVLIFLLLAHIVYHYLLLN